MDEPIECTEDDKDAARSAFYYARIALENHGIEPTDDEAACADFVLAIVKYIKAEPNAPSSPAAEQSGAKKG